MPSNSPISTVAVTVYWPAVVGRVQPPSVAVPVVSVFWAAPVSVPAPSATVKVTSTLGTPWPAGFFTTTEGRFATAVLTVACRAIEETAAKVPDGPFLEKTAALGPGGPFLGSTTLEHALAESASRRTRSEQRRSRELGRIGNIRLYEEKRAGSARTCAAARKLPGCA